VITFLINRAQRRWQVLSTLLLGVLISTAFLASGPIVVNTVIDFALPHKLRSSIEENGIIYLSTYNNLGEREHNLIKSKLRDIFTTNLGKFTTLYDSTTSPWLYAWQGESITPDERLNLRAYGGVEDRITFITGSWPESSILLSDSFQAIIPEAMADAYSLQVGDRLAISKNLNDDQPSYWLEVSGIFFASDAGDSIWLMDDNSLQPDNNRYAAEFGVIIREDDYFDLADALFPNANQQIRWLAVIKPDGVVTNNLKAIVTGIENVRTNISNSFDRKVTLATNLDKFLLAYESNAYAFIPPLYLLIGEVMLLGLYYVVMVAALSIRNVEGELAVLTSRGAELHHLLKIQLFDALLICITAFIFGPLLAYGLIELLAYIGPLTDITQVDWVIRMPAASWLAAGVSVLACFTALIIPVIPILRRSIVQHHQATTRRLSTSWWHKYYIDVFLLVIGLASIWRLSIYGSISGVKLGNIDWLLLLSPLALLLGSAMLVLRLLPGIFRFLASIVARSKGLTAPIALWHTARDPTYVTRLVFLLTLAMALGILSTGLNATLSYSEHERARHSTGGEARLSFDEFIPSSMVNAIPQVTHTSTVWRGEGRANVRSYRSIPNFSILEIEPISFASVAQFRTDYTDEYIGYILGQLIVDPQQLPVSTIPIPGEPSKFGLWIADPFPGRNQQNILEFVEIRAKLQSSQGQINIFNLELAPSIYAQDGSPISLEDHTTESSGLVQYLSLIFRDADSDFNHNPQIINREPTWRYYETDLPEYTDGAYPLALHSLWIKIRQMPSEKDGYTTSNGPLIIDDLSIRDDDKNMLVFEDFEELNTIWQTDSSQSIASYTKSDITHSGEASMRLYLGIPDSSDWMVLSPAQTTRINFIPILASQNFLQTTELNVGDKFAAYIKGISLMLEIKNTVNYFPTMYEFEEGGFVVLSRDALLAELNRSSRIPVNYNEIWLREDESQDSIQELDTIPQVKRDWDITSERLLYKSDPLTLGLRSVIFLGYLMTLLLSLVGYATYMYMSIRERGPNYGILRSIGLSTSQLYRSLVLEQLLLISAGLALGILLGSILNQIILPSLPISFANIPPIPPFIPRSDWVSILRLIIIIMFGFLVTLAIGTYLLWRAKLHQVLRVSEE